MNSNKNMKEIINHLKNTGFVFKSSEIYGGLANTWDYGPLGVLLKEKIKQFWWKYFISSEINNHRLDTKILLNPEVWKASGHIDNFSDPLIENKINKKRYRADHIVEELYPEVKVSELTKIQLEKFIKENIKHYDASPTEWGPIREFNLMFETAQGVIVGEKSSIFLRPETAQGIFINFKNILRATRSKLPLGIGQIGKSFRNEVTPGNFIFRTREFEQMELEIFVEPQDAENQHKKYIAKMIAFLHELNIKEESIRLIHTPKSELAHYAKAGCDIEFLFPFGWGELLGVANRGDHDLKSHAQASKENLEYRDPVTNEVFVPYVIEPSVGLDRLMLALIVDAYHEEQLGNETRLVLKLDKKIAPYTLAILPLTKKQSNIAKEIYALLTKLSIDITYDEAGSIGKRYRRQDSIGTPYCLTIDYDSESDQMITIRDRDSMQQDRIAISEIANYLKQ